MSEQSPTIEAWKLIYEGWNPEQQKLREALCTLGNGYFATRGAREEAAAGDVHYPGTYLAGGYNRRESTVAGRVIENEDLVNWPNWLCLTFRIEGGPWFHINDVVVQQYRQELDLKRGVLTHHITFRDEESRITHLTTQRFVSMHDENLAAIHWKLDPHNWSGRIEVRTALDASVKNAGVDRYRALNGQHLTWLESGQFGEAGIYTLVETNQSHIRMAQATRLKIYYEQDDIPVKLERKTVENNEIVVQHLEFEVQQHHIVCFEKIVGLYTSRDLGITEPQLEACQKIQRAGRFAELLADHELAWGRLWSRSDLEISNHGEAQGIVRLHIFHLFQTVSPHSIEKDAGAPARGWHGEAYRGHIFWDELFIFPFINYTMPTVTEALLMYRYRRLDEARIAAREAGYEGAMYPWQSGSNGREESQLIHLNPKSGRWLPDDTYLQRHVSSAIAYNVWQYYEVTNDLEFMHFYGAEMFIEIARFWASIAELDEERNRYVINGVVGPDEYHTHYPDSDEPGLNNNAYTNFMAAWVLKNAQKILKLLNEDRRTELLAQLGIPTDELGHWDVISRKMYIPFLEDGIISQFEGYEHLAELDLEKYREQFGQSIRLDRVLESEGDDPNKYKVSKQADVLMLFYLFSAEVLQEMFEHMNYPFDPQTIPDNIEYYLARTSHGSTLSQVVYSWVWSRANREKAWYHFEKALTSDVHDVQGGTTPEGIHLGAMGGTIDLVQRCYTGLEVRDGVLWLNPVLPQGIRELKFNLRYRSQTLNFVINHKKMTISFDHAWWDQTIKIGFEEEIHVIDRGQTKVFALK